MVDAIGIGLVAAGLVLLFAGAALSVYGVALLGGVLGGGVGYLLAPTLAGVTGLAGGAATAAAVALGLVVGVVLAYALLSLAVAAASFVVGAYLGLYVFAPILVGGAWYVNAGVALAAGIAAALLGSILTRSVLIVITSFVGAAFASRSLTVADFQQAGAELTIEPLVFEVLSPVFLGLLTLGVLSQLGLFEFGYVTRLAAILPGFRQISDRGDTA